MATSEQLALSSFIKSVHKTLREESKLAGSVETAWENHCKKENVLEHYAKCMRKLSTYWENNHKTNNKVLSRITWTYDRCIAYFFNREILYHRTKEVEIASKINTLIPESSTTFEFHDCSPPLTLLDVGSCFNPFKIFQCFEVLPIDIAPANDDVIKCDFLSVIIDGGETNIINKEVVGLKVNSFDVIVFSLLLEYFPSADQRLQCCAKAYDLLKFEGVLIIITPDSKHVGANAKIMKSWRFALAELGFSRIKYEKLPHLHCMVFRKSLRKEIAIRWASLHKMSGTGLVIPQDFNSDSSDKSDNLKTERTSSGLDEKICHELP